MSRGLLPSLFLVFIVALSMPCVATADGPTATASPGASPILIDPLDPRAGQAASRVGAPGLALIAVLGLGLVAAAGTAVYVVTFQRR